VYCASFIWQPGIYDADFERLNAAIDQVARSSPGFLGVEVWQSGDGARKCANYYWSDLETLRAFSVDPVHQEAKWQYARWYEGYHIVISQVLRSYGDGSFEHLTPNDRPRPAA
jgi:heme-degrading monooxygenase HmoA